jgi:hypothetical protein
MPKQSTPIELGGKTKHLRYDFNALVAMEDELGIPISEIGDMMAGSVKLKDLRSLIWAGLIHEDKSLTPSDVGEWLEFEELDYIAEKVRVAFESAFPEEADVKKK